MYCFLCDKLEAKPESLRVFDVPICTECQNNNNQINYYLKKSKTIYNNSYLIDPPFLKSDFVLCDYCKSEFLSDVLFEYYGFSKNVCPLCLKKPSVNIELSNLFLQPIWRNRRKLI